MSKSAPAPEPVDPSCASCLRLGWAMIALFLLGGMALEAFHLLKLPLYVDTRLRRELWTLAHAHGTLLGAVNVLFGLSATRGIEHAARRARAARMLRFGAVLVPAGFFLGGIGAAEGDPSLFVVLVPLGALLALAGVSTLALELFRKPRG